jgi:hypothetical protein
MKDQNPLETIRAMHPGLFDNPNAAAGLANAKCQMEVYKALAKAVAKLVRSYQMKINLSGRNARSLMADYNTMKGEHGPQDDQEEPAYEIPEDDPEFNALFPQTIGGTPRD